MPNYQLAARIKCPYYKNQQPKSMTCAGFFDNQLGTKLFFNDSKKKDQHIKDFCINGCWKGCPLAIAITEHLEMENEDK